MTLPSRPQRWWVAAAVLALQVAAALHLVVVPHAMCREHGELVDASTAPAPAAAPRDLSIGAGADAAAGHDHCLVALLSRQSFFSPHATLARNTVAPPQEERPPRLQSAGWATALTVAPKQSPPRA